MHFSNYNNDYNDDNVFPLPVTCEVTGLHPLTQVAGQEVDGEETPKHNVPRNVEEVGGDVRKPFS